MRRAIDPPEPRRPESAALSAAICAAAFVGLAYAALFLPPEASHLSGIVERAQPESGLGNAVNAVLLNFRGFDTLLEMAILVLALVGLWGLAPDAGWDRPPGNFHTAYPAEPQLLVLLKVLVPLVLLTAIYLLWLGADEPGGAFQSGTILAAVGILLVLSRVVPQPAHGSGPLRGSVALGFVLFAGVGMGTALFGRGFLDYPPGFAKPFVLVIETGLAVSIAVSLFLLAGGLPRMGEAGRGAR